MTWSIASMAALLAALAAMVAAFERGRISTRTLGLVAALAALAVAGRLAFAPLPNVKPTTDIVLIAGFALGARCGFAVGAITALVSNMVFGQGPWTPWQMLAWGVAGLFGAALARVSGLVVSRWVLASAAAAAGLVFGAIMDLSQWLTYSGTPKEATLIAYSLTSLPWNLAHAAGNFGFAFVFGPALLAIVMRARIRSEPVWLPRGATINGIGVVSLALAAALGFQPALSHVSTSASTAAAAVSWLASTQVRDGGFPVASGSGSSPRETAWAGLALAAAGRQPSRLRRGSGSSLLVRLKADARALGAEAPEDRIGAAERLLLAATAAGDDGRSFGGRDLVSYVRSRVKSNGSVDYYPGEASVDLTAYAVLALRGAGLAGTDPAIRRAVRWLIRERQPGGGWSTTPRSVSAAAGTPDSTGAVLQALKAVGHQRDGTVSRAVWMLQRTRRAGGGWTFGPGGSNAQSTALAVLGLRAWEPDSATRATAWFEKVRGGGGVIRLQPGSRSTPVWVTAQAVLAMSGRTLPLRIIHPATNLIRAPAEGSGSHVASARAGASGSRGPAAGRSGAQLDYSVRAAAFAGRLAGALAKSFGGANR